MAKPKKYIRLFTECQWITLKEPHYIHLHLLIPQFPMSFISMGLYGPYHETQNGNQYALTNIHMLANYVFMIPIKLKNYGRGYQGLFEECALCTLG